MRHLFHGINRGQLSWHERESRLNKSDGICAVLALALLILPAIFK